MPRPVDVLQSRAAIITGAARGIGAAVAERLARDRFALVLNDFDAAALTERANSLRTSGASVEIIPGSVVEQTTSDNLVAVATERFGDLSAVVTCAGYADGALLHKMEDEQWFAMLDVHLTGTYRVVKAALTVMRERAKEEEEPSARKIITIASRGAFGSAGLSNYSAAKAGVIGFTKAVALEGARHNILANAVAFGMMDTRLTRADNVDAEDAMAGTGLSANVRDWLLEQTPLRRAGTLAEAAGAVAFLAGDDSNYMTGQVLHVNGGSRI